jgi:hypothetical protein
VTSCTRALGWCAALSITSGVLIDGAFAHEPGDFSQYFRGVTIGDPLGAAPPPGLYFQNTTMYAPRATGHGQVGGFKVNAPADIPTLFWSTGWNFLGASVLMAVAQPYYVVNAWGANVGGPPFTGTTHYPALHNTWVNPLTLSWNLGNGWFFSSGFAFYVPDGSRYDNSPNPDYWTFEPNAALSYLGGGWNLTAHLAYNFNGSSAGHTGAFALTPVAAFGVGYRSGDQAYLDLTATKKFDKWEIGPVGYLKWQTTDDRPGAGVSCATMAAVTASQLTCGRATDFAVGALVGYDFGPVALKTFVTQSVYTKDDFGGVLIWTKLAFRLWGPDATPAAPVKPLIHK